MSHMDMDFGSSEEQQERIKNLLVTEINQCESLGIILNSTLICKGKDLLKI